MRVVVTGATSMLGIALIKKCIENDDEILALVRPSTNRMKRIPESPNIKVVGVDISDISSIEVPGDGYDVFYHFAWEHTVKEERDNPIFQEDNIRHSLEAVELAKHLGCKKFVGAGSQAEYGIYTELIDEDIPASPNTAYGMAKLSANMLCGKRCSQLGMDFIWGRIFSAYGKNDNPGTMLRYAIDKFQKDEEANFSACTQMWNYINETDAGEIFYRLGALEVSSGIYHVASSKSMVLSEYIKIVDRACGGNNQYSFAKDSVYNGPSLNVDMSKTYNAIGQVDEISFADGIKEML